MTEQDRLKILAHIFDLMQDCAERYETFNEDFSCDNCMSNDCSLDRPCCDTMKARRARHELRRLIEPPMESLHPQRLCNPAERIFHEAWQKTNERHSCLNHGFTALEWILCPEGQRWPDPISHRDAQVATSVVQWLGTSCGGGFLHETEGRVNRERVTRSGLERDAIKLHFGPPDEAAPSKLDEWAKIIASRSLPVTDRRYADLEHLVRTALRRAYDIGARHADNFVSGTA